MAVHRLGDHLDVVLGLEERPEAGPDQRLVIGHEHPDRHDVATGSVARNRQPPPPIGPASRVPPTARARSRIPRRPCPVPSGAGAPTGIAPRPSSVTSTTT